MKIGSLKVAGNIFLAPMAGVNDLPFRLMCKKYGAALTYTQMVSADALIRNNKNSYAMIESVEEEEQVAVQMFGTTLPAIQEAIKRIEQQASLIDFNMGCPFKELTDIGCGAATLEDKEKIAGIVSTMKESTDLPITVKIRTGYKQVNASENAKVIEENGADAIAIHARTAKQLRSGKADWDIIKQVKEERNIPIIGNGDVFSGKDAEKMFHYTNCDAILVGRSAIGNPHVFQEIIHYLKTGEELPPQTPVEKINDFYEYLKLAEKYKNPDFLTIRQHASYFTRGFPGGAVLRTKLLKAKEIAEMVELLQDYQKRYNNGHTQMGK